MQMISFDAKATTLNQELGEVRLLVSTYETDRGGDAVQPGAFAKTIARWRASGNRPPLAWNHETGDPRSLIGTVDPQSMRETEAGLVVEAKLDLDGSETAREAWRLIKAGSLFVSFGYSAKTRQRNGTRLLTEVDLLEVSLTATPMNPGARVLSHKAEAERRAPEPSGELEWLHQFLQRDRDDVVREYLAGKQAEVVAERKSKPIQLASFSVEVR